jgi:hypothetical protein
LDCKNREESIGIIGTGRKGLALWRQRGKGWRRFDRKEGLALREREEEWLYAG